MRTGIYGEIMGAPTESLIFTVRNLERDGTIRTGIIEMVYEVIKSHIYYEPVIAEMLKIIPEKHLQEYMKYNDPKNQKYRFTDDTVCSIATMDAILSKNLTDEKLPWKYYFPFKEKYQEWCNKFPNAGYGGMFQEWIVKPDPQPYNSFGNGGAMRSAPIGYLYKTNSYILTSIDSCSVTHNNPEGIRGGLAVVDAVATALATKDRSQVKDKIQKAYYYNLERTLADVRKDYQFYVDAARSVPEAIIAFLESTSGINAVENAISLGGDTDTQAMIAGSLADAYYGYDSIPQVVLNTVEKCLPKEMMNVLEKFEKQYILK